MWSPYDRYLRNLESMEIFYTPSEICLEEIAEAILFCISCWCLTWGLKPCFTFNNKLSTRLLFLRLSLLFRHLMLLTISRQRTCTTLFNFSRGNDLPYCDIVPENVSISNKEKYWKFIRSQSWPEHNENCFGILDTIAIQPNRPVNRTFLNFVEFFTIW